ncbi:protein hunchback [Monomorium pharaonis]|uniref:protein hunchback n=1 Tax=Monomorium pharaonis TaxID=307658 RepID=UPI00063F0FC3|nr:protein hunchback [Monomorium pharaonis]
MKRYHEDNVQFLGPNQQQHEQQQQTAAEKQRCPLLPQTTPVWGDRNVSVQSAEETNNNIDFLFDHSIPSTSDSKFPTCDTPISMNDVNSPPPGSNSTENSIPMMNNHPSDAAQLPRICKLCPCVSTTRNEYINHVITHCTITRSSHVENDFFNEPSDDDKKTEVFSNESRSKGKKKNKVSKPKTCPKHTCGFIANTKLDLWQHLREHFFVHEDCSGFVCPYCRFATFFKHHMTFHWFSAHDDFKAFACEECSYACVSKSMLTSHKKTHSAVYQYNCGTCVYKTKFCNAIKRHLKETLHTPGPVLNPDGTPNPFATIDVYGSKRGPRRKPHMEQKRKLTEDSEIDMPSTSEITSPISLPPPSVPVLSVPIPISSAPAISSIATSNLPKSELIPLQTRMLSPIQRSPNQMSLIPVSHYGSPHSNSLDTASLATCNSTNFVDELNPNDPYNILCQLVYKEILTCQMDAEERGRMFRLLGNAQRFCSNGPGHIEHLTKAAAVNGDFFNKTELSSSSDEESSTSTTPVWEPQPQVLNQPNEPLDLSMSAMSKIEDQPQLQQSVASSSRHRKRKSKATKIEYPTINEYMNNNETQTQNTKGTHTKFFLPASELPLEAASQFNLERNIKTNVTHNAKKRKKSFICYYCHIMFENEIMYAIHMSFHNTEDPLMCSICYQQSTNIVAFFLHLIHKKH